MIKKTTDIILNLKKQENLLVVVSAMSHVTNKLIELCELAET
jgi:aspartokinase